MALKQLKAKWPRAVSPVCAWCRTISVHLFMILPPSARSSCYAAVAGSLPRSSPASPGTKLSSFFFSFSFLTSYSIIGQQNVCHIRANAEAAFLLLLLLPLPLSFSLFSFLCCLTIELHSGYVRTEVKVSLPLSRETQNRGALEEIVHKGGERDRGKNSTHSNGW